MKGGEPGSGARYAVPTIGDLTTPGWLWRSDAEAGGTADDPAPDAATGIAWGPGPGATSPAVTWIFRATRSRSPDLSISISLKPVSFNSWASSRIASCSTLGLSFWSFAIV